MTPGIRIAMLNHFCKQRCQTQERSPLPFIQGCVFHGDRNLRAKICQVLGVFLCKRLAVFPIQDLQNTEQLTVCFQGNGKDGSRVEIATAVGQFLGELKRRIRLFRERRFSS